MSLRIGDIAPDFTALSTTGPINLYDYMDESWVVLFSHPKDFTPVCTTEMSRMEQLSAEFDKRDVKLLGLSVDTVEDHRKWSMDIARVTGKAPSFPLIGDSNLAVAKLYGMLPSETAGDSSKRTAADNKTVRSVFVIGPDKTIKAMIGYPMTTGRNFSEVLRVIDSLQMTASHAVATPADWQHGEGVIILPAIGEEEAHRRFPDGWRAPLPYIRFVPQPTA